MRCLHSHLVCARTLSLLLLFLLILAATNAVAAMPVLTLNCESKPPFINSSRTGFVDVITTEAFRRAGLELRLVKLPAERALRLANDGIIDGELIRIAGMEKLYPNLVPVPEKLMIVQFVAFSKDASIPSNFTALRGRRVGLLRGWKIFEREMAGNANAVIVEDDEQLFRLLQLGRIEVALYSRQPGLALIKKQGFKDIRLLQPILTEREMFIYLNKRHAIYIPKLAAALRAMKQDGFYDRAYKERLLPYSIDDVK